MNTMTAVAYSFGLLLFLAGVVGTMQAASTESREEKTEFRVIAICLMLTGIGIWIGILTAKSIGLF